MTSALRLGLLCAVSSLLLESIAWSYDFHNGSASASRWTTTSQGSTGAVGRPADLTWSIVPDGTSTVMNLTTFARGPSDLIATLDATFGAGPGGTDYTLRPWFTHYEESFERWEELSGLTFTYEDDDTGSSHGGAFTQGINNVRGDVRMSGIGIDGVSGTLAYSYFPNVGDQALDTDDTAFFGNPSGDYIRLRNTIMHELGHGLGLEHIESTGAGFLMEPNISTAFDGPQHDDLLGIHAMYGDVLEKTNNGAGNETYLTAHDLGSLASGGSLAIGTAGSGTIIGSNETDFVSIANSQDDDYFAFTVSESLLVDITLTPRGATYNQGAGTLNTLDDNNLAFTLFNTNGTSVLSTVSSAGAGIAEMLDDFTLPGAGEYFIRVDGSSSAVQMYQLDIEATGFLPDLFGDYNLDGIVNAPDYTVWRDTIGTSVTPYTGADGDGDGFIGIGDYNLWVANFGTSSSSSAASAVPEPSGVVILVIGAWIFACRGTVNYSE